MPANQHTENLYFKMSEAVSLHIPDGLIVADVFDSSFNVYVKSMQPMTNDDLTFSLNLFDST